MKIISLMEMKTILEIRVAPEAIQTKAMIIDQEFLILL
jgi:hypothetical protein